jgi:F0F1-type ATP synthase membrane subunit c/vacuolar-type H+-ATPase subunit K
MTAFLKHLLLAAGLAAAVAAAAQTAYPTKGIHMITRWPRAAPSTTGRGC